MTDEEYIANDDRLETEYPPSREYQLTITHVQELDGSMSYEADLSEWESNAGGVTLANASADSAMEAAITVIKEAIYDFDD